MAAETDGNYNIKIEAWFQAFIFTKSSNMTNGAIAKFCETKDIPSLNCIRIDFTKRRTIYGFIIAASDYDDLKSKNFWRIVLYNNIQKWENTGELDLAKIYNGTEFTRLSFAENKKAALEMNY